MLTLVSIFVPLHAVWATTSEAPYHDDAWMWGVSTQSLSLIQSLGTSTVVALPIPVFGVHASDLTQNFGDARGGGARTHEGLDIVAPHGTPVASPTDAVVLQVGDGVNSGLVIRTANPGGEIFVYMHLSKIMPGLVQGAYVRRGDIIGLVGNTGNAADAGPHLHFEIRQNGAQNPYPRLVHTFTPIEWDASIAQVQKTDSTVFVAQSTSALTKAVEAPAPRSVSFARDLEVGMEGADIRALQRFLNTAGYSVASSGAGSSGHESTYFGERTRRALVRFQKAHDIVPAVGYLGPKTRARIAAL